MDGKKNTPWKIFENSLNQYPENVLIIHNQTRLTYCDVNNKVIEFVSLIDKYKFVMAGIYLPNCPEYISCMLAFNKVKKPVVYLSFQLRGEPLKDLIKFTDIEVLVTDSKGFAEIENYLPDLKVKAVIKHLDDGTFEMVEFYRDFEVVSAGINEDTFGICFTSGSTSKPKGIMLSNGAISGNAIAVAEAIGFGNRDITLIPRSFAQASPISGDILMAISAGGGIIILNDLFHPAVFLKAVEEHGATTVFMIRTMLSQILEYKNIKSYDISSLKCILLGGMLNPKSIFEAAEKILPGIKVYNAYGISEASARVTFATPENLKAFPGTIGKPMRGCEITIFREDGSEAQCNEIGEIFIKSAYLMDGYYKDEELTLQTLTEKGLRTRDTGYVDTNGMFYVSGRSDDLIIQGGNKVYPIDIEEVLLKNRHVKEAVVLGVEDEKLGKKIVAFVRIENETKLEVQDLFKWCRLSLEDRKVPKQIHIVEEIPRNMMGKINKNQVRAHFNNLI